MYEKSCEMIYFMISERIRYMKNKLKKRYNEIEGIEESLMCAIAHNRRDDKKNKYLLPYNKKLDYTQIITSSLGFDSPNALLWGNESEIEAYSGKLFESLIFDALKDDSIAKRVYAVLSDYIPFALAKFYYLLWEDYPSEVELIIDKKYFTNQKEFDKKKKIAINRIYHKIDFLITHAIRDFLYTRECTFKLNGGFSNFLKETLLPLMENSVSTLSIGKDVENILDRNNRRMIELYNYELQLSPETIGYHENDQDYYDRHIVGSVVESSMEYIENLARIQKENEGFVDESPIENTWEVQMCDYNL